MQEKGKALRGDTFCADITFPVEGLSRGLHGDLFHTGMKAGQTVEQRFCVEACTIRAILFVVHRLHPIFHAAMSLALREIACHKPPKTNQALNSDEARGVGCTCKTSHCSYTRW
eukprot:746500-Rhodomonas_salina.1